jgi:hypothetical protein
MKIFSKELGLPLEKIEMENETGQHSRI